MTKYSDPELQSLLLDLYAMHGTDTAVAKLSGVSRVTLWRMQNMSEEGQPELQECDWAGVLKPWHEHKLDALDVLVEDVQQRMTHDAGQGQWVPVVHGGLQKFREDEYAMSLTAAEFKEQLAMSDEDREFFGYPRIWEDKMMRVQNPKTGVFERLPLEQYLPPTLDAQSKVLSSFAPETFGDKRKIDLNVTGGLGVTVIGQNRPLPQQLEVLQEVSEAITDETVTDEIDEIEYQPPEPVMSEPEPFTADPNSPLTEEQQRILARSRSTNPGARKLAELTMQKMAQAKAPVAAKPMQMPPPSAYRGDDPDDCIQRTPRGQKMV